MGTIRERVGKKGKTYHAQVRRKGFPPETQSFRTKASAERWIKATEVKMDDGVFVNQQKSKDTTLLAALNMYEVKVTPKKKSALKERSIIKTLKDEKITLRTLATLRSSDFTELRDDWLLRPVKPLKPSSVVRRLALLSHLYTVCRSEWGFEGLHNPLLHVTKPTVKDGRNRTIELSGGAMHDEGDAGDNSHSRETMHDEIQYLVASTSSKTLGPAIRFAVATAMRRSEITRLEWSCVKFSANNRGVAHLPETKNDEPRDVPLSPEAVAILREQKSCNQDQDRVFPITADALTRAFNRALERARKKYEESCLRQKERPSKTFLKGLRFHDLRHEAITQISKHFELQELAAISGHKSTTMLLRYYHPDPDYLAKKFPERS